MTQEGVNILPRLLALESSTCTIALGWYLGTWLVNSSLH